MIAMICGGLAAAIALRRAGIAVRVFEQAPTLREATAISPFRLQWTVRADEHKSDGDETKPSSRTPSEERPGEIMNRGSNCRWSNGARSAALVAALIGVTLISGCSDSQPGPITSSQPAKGGAGSIGVVILIDTSGSMKDPVPDKDGKKRPKFQLANEALTEILRQTADWTRDHKDKPLNLSISTFSDKTRPVLAMAPFDKGSADAAVKAVPAPNGGTAIGLALRDAWNVLKPVGCEREYILCITDGENTAGTHPREVVPAIHKESDGKVEIHFIAFDVDSKLFDFAKPYNGHVSSAANKEQLDAELTRIFQKRILLDEAP